MSNKIAIRSTLAMREAVRIFRGSRFVGVAAVIAVSVMAANIVAFRLGGSAAAEDSHAEKALDLNPVSLAGRWSGSYYGYARGGEGQDCSEADCKLTYDIVACKEGWCGIAVKSGSSCGAVALHLTAEPKTGDHMMRGSLEIAKGAAPYAVAAWRNVDKDTGVIDLHFIGNTGAELLLFRRSYPFEASLTRSGDAVCTLDKTTS
jgi:hypothetical protein